MVSPKAGRHFVIVLGLCAALVFPGREPFLRATGENLPPKRAQGSNWAEPQLTLRQNGDFSAEHGIFVAEGQQLHVYSVVPEFWDEPTGTWKPSPQYDALRRRWKGEPYYHELYGLKEGKWVRIVREFSEGPESWVDFGPCDPLNQMDLAGEKIRNALPHSTRIKSVSMFPGYALVVYSEAPREPYPRHSLDEYSQQVALLIREGQSWRNAGTLDGGADGFYCGTRTISAKLANGEPAALLLLYSDEPAASSNFRTVRSYIVSYAVKSNREQGPEPVKITDAERESRLLPAAVQAEACSAPGQPGEKKKRVEPERTPLERLVRVVADTESGFHSDAIHVIPKRARGKALLDANGKPVADTVNYGLMQINSVNIGKTTLNDAQGNPFTIGPDIITDWKANARAGVALLARQYQLAAMEQGTGGTDQSCAQQSYAGYHGGTRNRFSYLHLSKE